MKHIVQPLEVLVVALLVLMTQGVFWPPLSYLERPQFVGDVSDPFSVGAHLLLALLLAVACVARPLPMLSGIRTGWLLFALVGLAYLSAFWSDAPELVLRRATTLAETTLFAVYLITRFDLDWLIALLVKLNLLAVIASFAVVLLNPRLGLSGIVDYPTAWRGIYSAKNTLGSASAFGAIIASYALWRGYGSRVVAAALIPANLALLHFSQSATSFVLLFATAAVAIVAVAFRQRSGAGFITGYVLLIAGLLGTALVIFGRDELLIMLGRNPTLTSRSDIWEVVWTYINRQPWLGYGYGVFWRTSGLEARQVWGTIHFVVPHAHNAWLETGLALGFVGMAGLTLLWLAALYRGIRVLLLPDGRHAPFCLALFTAILVVNMTEYEFFKPDSFLWLIFAAAFVHLGREIVAYRTRGAAMRVVPHQPVEALAYLGPRPTALPRRPLETLAEEGSSSAR